MVKTLLSATVLTAALSLAIGKEHNSHHNAHHNQHLRQANGPTAAAGAVAVEGAVNLVVPDPDPAVGAPTAANCKFFSVEWGNGGNCDTCIDHTGKKQFKGKLMCITKLQPSIAFSVSDSVNQDTLLLFLILKKKKLTNPS